MVSIQLTGFWISPQHTREMPAQTRSLELIREDLLSQLSLTAVVDSGLSAAAFTDALEASLRDGRGEQLGRLLREADRDSVGYAIRNIDSHLLGSLLGFLSKRMTNAFWLSTLQPWLDVIPLRANDLRNHSLRGALLRIRNVLETYDDVIQVEMLKGAVEALLAAQ